MHLVLRLRGGMHHFSSGRQNFSQLSYGNSLDVKNVFTFKCTGTRQMQLSTQSQLQDLVLQAQTIL